MDCHPAQNHFDNPNIKEDLKNRSIKGGGVVIGAQICKFFIKFLSTLVLARLITPQDFGLVAMVAVITNFVAMFKDMGLSMATVQQEEITQEQVSMLFWINLAVSAGVTALTIAIAPFVSLFFDSPRLRWITIVLASGFLVSGVSVQHQALLVRQMRYGALAVVDILSMLVGVTLGISAAYRGMSYWSLVIIQLSTVFVMSLGLWIACSWRPGLPVRSAGVRSMLHYGSNLTGFSVLNYFTRNLDNVLIGKYWGPHQLGLYDRAYQLMLLPISQFIAPLSSIAIPVLSRLQDNPERYRRYYFGALNLLAFIMCPLMVTMAVMSNEVVTLLLGPQWSGAGLIFKSLSIAAIIQPLGSSLGWVYQSLGKTDRMMRWAMITVPIYIISFIVGLSWGANGVAIAYTICSYMLLIPGVMYAYKGTLLELHNFIESIFCPVVIGLFMYPVITLYRSSMRFLSPLPFLIGSIIIAILTLLLFILVWSRARKEVSFLLETLNLFRLRGQYIN